jgi:hypothetical protein
MTIACRRFDAMFDTHSIRSAARKKFAGEDRALLRDILGRALTYRFTVIRLFHR